MTRPLTLLLALLALAACVAAPEAARLATSPAPALPRMLVPVADTPRGASRPNAEIAEDILDLSFRLESGRELPILTRFEGPIRLRTSGPLPGSLDRDLTQLLERIRDEAGIEIARAPAAEDAEITLVLVPQRQLRRAVPEAACFVVPRVSSWMEFLRNRRGALTDWATLRERERLAIILPADAAPQEMRDCLHEELAQALGPLNDLYRLPDSVFNDDNFHATLTGFDMLALRALYDPALRSGMTRGEVASRLPAILARLNPAGERPSPRMRSATSRVWMAEIERALGPSGRPSQRIAAAERAVALAEDAGWGDQRLGFSLYALGRLALRDDPDRAFAAFARAGQVFAGDPAMRIHAAHVGAQMATFALANGNMRHAVQIADAHVGAARDSGNAALLATLLMTKAEAMRLAGAPDSAPVRDEAIGWARYGYGAEVPSDARIAAEEGTRTTPAAG